MTMQTERIVIDREKARGLYDAERMFDTEADALADAQRLAAEADREERERIQQKEKTNKSWSWHASYHRREIERCKKEIERHTAKLNVAALKARSSQAAQVRADE